MHGICRTIFMFLANKGVIVMTTTLSIRIDRNLKEDVEELLEDLGLNLTTAITCFFKKTLDLEALPFTISRRKKSAREETLEAIEEAKRIAHDPNAPSCTDINKLDEFLFS